MSRTRRLAAILAADVAGFSRLIEADEEGTLGRLKTLRAAVIDPKIAAHRGRIVKTTGDGLLVEFASVVDALRCAAEIQAAMAESNAGSPTDRRIEFRIGIHQGDIVVEDGDIFGDGVNVAARLEGIAESGGICVSARVQEDAAGKLDLVFEDIGEQTLKNIARPVRAYRVVTATGPAIARPSANPPLPDKPSIAVLPFQNMSGDLEQEYFADGMVGEIITALSRIRWLFVIARNSSFTYKGQAIDVKQVGRELGIRYVLEGSVRKAGGRVRITAQLIDAQNGAHLWADRFDGSLEDVFDLQDKVAVSVAGIIEPTLRAAEIRRSSERPTPDLTAYDLLRALPDWASYEKHRIVRALDLLEKAIERDPEYGPALALAAHCHSWLAAAGDTRGNSGAALELARRALRAAPEDPEVLAAGAYVLGIHGEDIAVAISLVDRALALNPSFARGWLGSGLLRAFAGNPDLALEHFTTFQRLDPSERFPAALTAVATALFFKRRFNEAAAKLLQSLELAPDFAITHRLLASCYAHLGQIGEAQEIVGRLRAITPVVVPRVIPFRNSEHRELFLSGLRLAAGEKT
jgi:adenylate cyclase